MDVFVQLIKKSLRRSGWLRLCFFPSITATAKPIQVRMGKGKGAIDHWYAVVPSGAVLFEIADIGLDFLKVRRLAQVLSIRIPAKFRPIVIR